MVFGSSLPIIPRELGRKRLTVDSMLRRSEWMAQVPESIKRDALWSMEIYRSALLATDLAWLDIQRIQSKPGTRELTDQLYRAVCSVSANIAEGFSRSSGKDRTRFYEYALGSARESRDWYYKCRHILGDTVSNHRMDMQAQVIKQLLSIIPKDRIKMVREEVSLYDAENEQIPVANSE